MFLLFVCLFCFFYNSVSSSICKLPIGSEMYNCTVKNTKFPFIVIFVMNNYYWLYGIIILMFLSNPSKLKSKPKKSNQLEHFLARLQNLKRSATDLKVGEL